MTEFMTSGRGMDHEHYPWSPLPSRPKLTWPNDAAVACAVVILVEHIEVPPPAGSVQVAYAGDVAASLSGLDRPHPDLMFLSSREYGHRVGIFRLLDALQGAGIAPSVAIDVASAERYPALIDACRDCGAEFVAHGMSGSQMITSHMPPDQEALYIADVRDRLAATTGSDVVGWYGPEQSESVHTIGLLGDAGFEYVCDWPNDEQPYLMSGPHGLVSVPPSYPLDDYYALWMRGTPPSSYPVQVGRALEALVEDGRTSGRSLVLVVRPWLSGQPFRIAAFEEAVEMLRGNDAVWTTTTGGIAQAFRAADG